MERILSIECGFGYTKVAIMENGIITHRAKEMDSVVELTTVDFNSDLKIVNDSIYDYEGKKYLVGGTALQAVSENAKVLDVIDYDTFKYVTPILFKKYTTKLKGDFNKVVLSISYAYYEKAGEYKKFVADKTGYPIENIFVIPQSAAGKRALDNVGLDINNPSKKTKLVNYLIVDGGYNTLDISLVLDGKLLPVNIKGYAGEGVIKIANKLIPHIKSLSNEDVSFSKARQIIETRKYVLRGKSYEVSEFIDKAINDYIIGLGKFLEDNYKLQMNNIENIVIFGGLAELVRSKKDVFDTMYSPQFVKIPTEDSEYYNCIGAFYAPGVMKELV